MTRNLHVFVKSGLLALSRWLAGSATMLADDVAQLADSVNNVREIFIISQIKFLPVTLTNLAPTAKNVTMFFA